LFYIPLWSWWWKTPYLLASLLIVLLVLIPKFLFFNLCIFLNFVAPARSTGRERLICIHLEFGCCLLGFGTQLLIVTTREVRE
jgi:hypothetical protein